MYHAEGRCVLNAGIWRYEYFLKDHLGNTRVRFQADSTTVSFREESHYYPFGMLMEGNTNTAVNTNDYKYNGKELNTDLGLNLSDYGARWYDAALGRWWSVDPLAILEFSHSVYAYVTNNPIIFTDPSGMTKSIDWDGLNASIADYNEGIRKDDQAYWDWFDRTTVRAKGSISAPDNGYERWLNPRTGKYEYTLISDEGGNAYDVIYETHGQIPRNDAYVTWEVHFNSYPTFGMRTAPGEWYVPKNHALESIDLTDLVPSKGAMKGIIKYGLYKGSMLLIPKRLPVGTLFYNGGKFAAKGGSNLTKAQLKSISSLESQIVKHQTKLAEYIKDPMKFDNKGFLKNAPNDAIRQKIIQSRIDHLNQEIQTFQNNIQKILNGQ